MTDMPEFKHLAKLALVGVARGNSSGLEAPHASDSILAPLGEQSQETAILLRAGVRAVYGQAGQQFQSSAEPLLICESDAEPPASARAAQLIRAARDLPSTQLVAELLRTLKRYQRTLPHELLAEFLPVPEPMIREALLPVLGERGRWLARLSDEWSWVHEGSLCQSLSTELWDEGTLEERCQILTHLRRTDRAEALKRLQASLPQEKADHRARLIETLQEKLAEDDEPLLESLLDDRAVSVREIAAGLLGQLPTSRFAQRACERAATLLVQHTDEQGKLQLVSEPPNELPKEWARDSLVASKNRSKGERAEWLEKMIAQVPPSYWLDRFQTTPEQLIQQVRDDRFAEAVISGWINALMAYRDQETRLADWALPLWKLRCEQFDRSNYYPASTSLKQMVALFELLPAEIAETAVLNLMKQEHPNQAPFESFLGRIRRPWPTEIVDLLFQKVVRAIRSNARAEHGNLTASMHLATAAMDIEKVNEVRELLRGEDVLPGPPYGMSLVDAFDRFMDALTLRLKFEAELRMSTELPELSKSSEST